jgi:SpoVK/Ycf46/Vps4 family AAA+-type ATPase
VFVNTRDRSESSGVSSGSLQARVLSTFLNELDGITGQHYGPGDGIMVLAACSTLDGLDEALLRCGRLQHHVYLGLPTRSDIEAILSRRLRIMSSPTVAAGETGRDTVVEQTGTRTIPCSGDVSVVAIAEKLMSCKPCGADADGVCRKAVFAAIRRHIASSSALPPSSGNPAGDSPIALLRTVTADDFAVALAEMCPAPAANAFKFDSPQFVWTGSTKFSF